MPWCSLHISVLSDWFYQMQCCIPLNDLVRSHDFRPIITWPLHEIFYWIRNKNSHFLNTEIQWIPFKYSNKIYNSRSQQILQLKICIELVTFYISNVQITAIITIMKTVTFTKAGWLNDQFKISGFYYQQNISGHYFNRDNFPQKAYYVGIDLHSLYF